MEVGRGEADVFEGERTVSVAHVGDLIESAERAPHVAGRVQRFFALPREGEGRVGQVTPFSGGQVTAELLEVRSPATCAAGRTRRPCGCAFSASRPRWRFTASISRAAASRPASRAPPPIMSAGRRRRWPHVRPGKAETLDPVVGRVPVDQVLATPEPARSGRTDATAGTARRCSSGSLPRALHEYVQMFRPEGAGPRGRRPCRRHRPARTAPAASSSSRSRSPPLRRGTTKIAR